MNRITRWLGLIVPLLLIVIGATGLMAQSDSTSTGGKPDDVSFVITGVMGILVPAAATYAMSGLKSVLKFIDHLDTIPQQLIAFAVGFGVSKLAGVVGMVLPADLHAWTGDLLQSVLAGLATLGVHAIRKQK